MRLPRVYPAKRAPTTARVCGVDEEPMTIELDHVFVCSASGAPEADLLVAFGLAEGAPNTHPGQGTANRRFFFRNAMLELLWVRDEVEAQSSLVSPTKLWERWRYRATGFSPFGICLRPGAALGAIREALPFETWAYRPPYLPAGMQIDVATETSDREPLIFAAPVARRPDAVAVERRQPLDDPKAFAEITGLRITLPTNTPTSPATRALQSACPISLTFGDDHLADVEFDHANRGMSADFRPSLPLRFRW